MTTCDDTPDAAVDEGVAGYVPEDQRLEADLPDDRGEHPDLSDLEPGVPVDVHSGEPLNPED